MYIHVIRHHFIASIISSALVVTVITSKNSKDKAMTHEDVWNYIELNFC